MHRDIGRHRKTETRRLVDGRHVAGLASAIAPVVVGVVLAFAWDTAGSYKPASRTPGPGFSPEVEVAAEQAAAQTWARMTPARMTPTAMTGNSAGSAARDSSISARPAWRPARRGAAQQLHDLRAQALRSRV